MGEAVPLKSIDDWSPWWRFNIKTVSWVNVFWILFAGCLWISQVCLAACDKTAYEAEHDGSCPEFQAKHIFQCRHILTIAVRNFTRVLMLGTRFTDKDSGATTHGTGDV